MCKLYVINNNYVSNGNLYQRKDTGDIQWIENDSFLEDTLPLRSILLNVAKENGMYLKM